MKTDFQVTDHGAGKFSVQIFDADTNRLLEDRAIAKGVNGWRVGNGKHGCSQDETPRAAAQHYAAVFHDRRIAALA